MDGMTVLRRKEINATDPFAVIQLPITRQRTYD